MKERFETFTLLISKISRSIRKIENKEMEEYALRGPHLSCIYYLYTSDGLTVTELSDRCEEDKATVSRSIRDLKNDGYVETSFEQKKGYRSTLSLTEKGIVAGKRITDKISAVLAETGKALDAAQRDEFYRCLGIISDELEEIAERHG